MQRLKYIDIAKGIGIVLVVCSHSDAWSLMWITTGFFVPIFYFCAGYTFSSIKGTIVDMMKKRFRKLFMPYFFFTVVLICFFLHLYLREIVGFLYSRYCFYPIDVSPNIKFFTIGNYPMWFLTSMIVSYYLFYLIVYNEKYRIYIGVSYFALTFLFSYLPILLPWSIDTAFFTALIMYAGKLFKNQNVINMSEWIIMIVVFIYIGMIFNAGDINLSVRKYGNSIIMYYILAVCGCVVTLWFSHYIEKMWIGKVFEALGKHSLTIFCVQMVFIVIVQRLFVCVLPNRTFDWSVGLLETFVALLGGWLFSLLLHRNKILSRLLF